MRRGHRILDALEEHQHVLAEHLRLLTGFQVRSEGTGGQGEGGKGAGRGRGVGRGEGAYAP